MTILRQAQTSALRLARGLPIVALTGPRQAGKTTLARTTLGDKPYVDPEEREFALTDPRNFLARFPQGAILDEVQRTADCSISHVTAREWISVLEASYVVHLLRPWHNNLGKRLVKTPKLYFLDTSLVAWLLGIHDSTSLATHAQRGALFETLIVAEFIKHAFNAGRPVELYFWRDSNGHEIDLLVPQGTKMQPIEIKSGATFASNWLRSINKWRTLAGDLAAPGQLIWGGSQSYVRAESEITAWRDLPNKLATQNA